MKHLIINLIIFLVCSNVMTAQTVTDVDGNSYQTVVIGNQTWMKENLKVTRFNNLDSIEQVKSNLAWTNFGTVAYCNFQNDSALANVYGKLYNFYAMKDERRVCPQGWRIPNDSDWNLLANVLGGRAIAGLKMKEAGSQHWVIGQGDNMSGFTGLPGGYRWGKTGTTEGEFNAMGHVASFWSGTLPSDSSTGRWWFLSGSNGDRFDSSSRHKTYGFSIRCILGVDSLDIDTIPVDTLPTDTTTGIAEWDFANKVTIYPNPTSGVVEVRFEKSQFINKIQVEVYDLMGKRIRQTNTETTIDLSGEGKGMYLVRIMYLDKQAVSKVLVE